MSKFEKGGGGDNQEDGPEHPIEKGLGSADKNITAARQEVEAIGGVLVLKEKLANASSQTKESLRLLLKGTPLVFLVFAAIGIAPAELGSLLGKWTQDSVGNPNSMTYQNALEFGAYGAATLGLVMASVVAALGAGGSLKHFAEKMHLNRLKKKAKL